MAVPDDQKAAFVGTIRNLSTNFLSLLDQFRGVKGAYDNRDYFNNLVDADVEAAAPGLTAAQVISAVGSLDTIATFVTANNHDDSLHQISS
jgi:hypothetical protein